MLSTDLAGTEVLTSVAPIESLGWNVFVEQPVAEVYRKLNASILRTGLLLLGGSGDLGCGCAGARPRHGASDPHARRGRTSDRRGRPRPADRGAHRRRAGGARRAVQPDDGAVAGVLRRPRAQGRGAHARAHELARAADGDQRDPARHVGIADRCPARARRGCGTGGASVRRAVRFRRAGRCGCAQGRGRLHDRSWNRHGIRRSRRAHQDAAPAQPDAHHRPRRASTARRSITPTSFRCSIPTTRARAPTRSASASGLSSRSR